MMIVQTLMLLNGHQSSMFKHTNYFCFLHVLITGLKGVNIGDMVWVENVFKHRIAHYIFYLSFTHAAMQGINLFCCYDIALLNIHFVRAKKATREGEYQ